MPAAELPFCTRLHCAAPVAAYTPVKLIRGLFGRWPVPVVNYTSAEMTALVSSALQRRPVDLVHLDSIHMAAFVPLLRRYAPEAKIFLNWHNIESELMWRYSTNAPSLAHKLYARMTARQLERTEQWALAELDGHVVCSKREQQALLGRYPGAPVAVVENGVDLDAMRLADEGLSLADRRRIVYVGLMNYTANVEAVGYFARQIWPAVRQRFPHWTFTIVGANPTAEVRQLASMDGIEVTGTVDDVRPYYRDALAAVAPLLNGAGTRLKILEAMAAGVPVLSTPLGAEGLEVTHGKDCLLLEDPDSWLDAFTSLTTTAGRWESMRDAGLRLVRERYGWDVLGAQLLTHYDRWVKEPRFQARTER